MTTLTVAMPYYGAPHLVERALRSVLDQTHRDLQLLLIADGETPPISIRDERLTVYELPENRGTYFATAVALAAADSEWFTIHAADDWSEPDRFARLLDATEGVDAVFGGSLQHRGGAIVPRGTKFHRAGRRPKHIASIATGIFRTRAVQAFGWWSHPEFRVCWDSLMVNLALRVLPWRHVPDEFGYHRVVRAGSLTQSPASGLLSPYRREASQRRAEFWSRLVAADRSEWPAILAPAPEVASEVLFHSALLARSLGSEVAA